MNAEKREYFEQCFASNFDEQVENNAALADSKALCTGVLEKTLDEAFRNLALNAELTLADIQAEFIRRIEALENTVPLSAAAVAAAKGAIKETITTDFAIENSRSEGLVDEKKEKKEMQHFTIEMFKTGVERFCGDARLSVEEAGFKNLFLITARNAIRQNPKLLDFVLEPIERKKQLELLHTRVEDQRLLVQREREGVWGDVEANRLGPMEEQERRLTAQCARDNDNVIFYDRFIREFEKLLAEQIITAENALVAFAEGSNENLVPKASILGLTECGVFEKSSYVTTPPFLFDWDAEALKEFLGEKRVENAVHREKIQRLVGNAGTQSTGKADQSVCSSLMRLISRPLHVPGAETVDSYIPGAGKALADAQAKKTADVLATAKARGLDDGAAAEVARQQGHLTYNEKQAVFNPIIHGWEVKLGAREQEQVGERTIQISTFEKITQQISDCVDAKVKAADTAGNRDEEAERKCDSILQWLCSQSVRVQGLREIVRNAYAQQDRRYDDVAWFNGLVTDEQTGAKEWRDHLLGKNGRQGLNLDAKKNFKDTVMRDLKAAFSRLDKRDEKHMGDLVRNPHSRPAVGHDGLQNLMLSTLSIVWMAIHDRTKVIAPGTEGVLLADTVATHHEITHAIQLKEESLLQAFWEFQTEYGSSGNAACAHGTYNKIVESLNLLDPDVRIGDSADTDITTVLKDLTINFTPQLVQKAVKNSGIDLKQLSEVWSLKTPSREQRTLLKGFRGYVARQIRLELQPYVEKEFAEYAQALNRTRDLENVITRTMIPEIMERLHEHNLVKPRSWVREFISELDYEAALQQARTTKALSRPGEDTIRAVALEILEANKIARAVERVLIRAGVPICKRGDEPPENDIVVLLAPKLGDALTKLLASDEKSNAEQCKLCIRRVLEDAAPQGSLDTVSGGTESLIQNLYVVFDRAKKRAKQQHPLRLREISGYLNLLENTRRLENVGVAMPHVDFQIPLLPSVFPYEPNGDDRTDLGAPTFSVAATLQPPLEDQLPDGVFEQLRENGVSLDNLQMFFCVQNMPWNNSAFLLRPHPWLKPDAPVNQVGYNHSSNMQVSVSDIGIRFPQLEAIDNVRVHATRVGDVVYSGEPQFRVEGAQDFSNTHCFYSLCVDSTANLKRAALTLHWLLNDADHAQISALLPNATTLEAFSKKVEELGQEFTLNKPINGISPVKALNAMLQGGQQVQPSEEGQYRLPAAARREEPHQPVMHFGLAARQPQPVAVPAVNAAAQAAEAQRVRLELQRQEAVRQAEARRVEEARLAEAERQRQAAARVAAPAPVRGGRSRG